ncbi:D-3-phosphoglycerate dehydrogenase [Phycisphaerae bacterium RAS1]|nr:D-3-phosphoglycerate dehydrogenase [Phycisphaerae bacterium RAS1]
MKILVICEMPDFALDQLRALGCETVYKPNLAADALRMALADTGILVVGSGRVSADLISSAHSLQLIVRRGAGPANIAVEEASAQGVFVADCNEQHATAVAELGLGLLIALDRRIVENTLALREGRWSRAELAAARGLCGRTLGLLGYGAAGRMTAQRAHGFGMNVIAWESGGNVADAHDSEIEHCNWPRELAGGSDAVMLMPAVEGHDEVIVDAEFLAAMRPGAAFVHLGPPGVVDAAALAEAVRTRHLRVAIDSHAAEPTADVARFTSSLLALPGVIGTQHIGALTDQARDATAAEAVRVIRKFLVSGECANCLNLLDRTPATWQLVLRVRDQVGVMASILDAIRADGINAEEITSRVFTGAKAASCIIAIDERPSREALDAIRALPDVLHLELRALV